MFIDEIHTIVGAGAADGAIDAANILKPMLARREIQVVGATTIKEYRKYIERDPALERRFQPIIVEEPSLEETEVILKGIRDKYEAYHNVKITDAAIKSAIELSSRYINDRFLPDKAIDLIDEASSRARLKTFVEPFNLKSLEQEIELTTREKEDSISIQDYEKAAKLRDKESVLKKQLEEETENWHDIRNKKMVNIEEDDIAQVVANWTGIPVQKISQTENERLIHLEEELHKRIVGQNEAVEAVSRAIRRSRVGLENPKKPIGSFLFLGPTGVGKTELTKALAECLFGDESSMIRIDMSEFMEGHSVSKLIGSPPGYVGYEESGMITDKIRKKPYSVILFDEIEKAHPEVMNLLLQILDDGRLTDNQGRTVNFKNTVIIMTSNIGARRITERKKMGFSDSNYFDENSEIKKDVMQEVRQTLKPEFINRIDEIIVFHKLTKENISEIIDIMLNEVKNKLNSKNINLKIDDNAKKLILRKGINTNLGARPLRRTIQNLIEDRLAEEILNGFEGNEIFISSKGEEITINEKISK